MTAPSASVERAKAKESFAPDEPLPAFTFPAIDEATKEELLRRVEEARSRAPSSVERVKAKESFAPEEPLPAFTLPAIDEATKEELLRRVEETRAASVGARTPPPPAPSRLPEVPPKSRARPFDPARVLSDAGRIGHGAWARASAAGLQWIDTASAFIDRGRLRLPERFRVPLTKVRNGTILAALGTLALGILVAGFLLIGTGPAENPAPGSVPSAPPPVPTPKEDPVPREIEEAKKQGHSALEKLAAEFPKDHRVWLELAGSSSATGDHAAAVGQVGKALAADPEANQRKVASDLLALAVRKRATANAAFDLLQGPMGPAGATVLYDLSIDPEVTLPLRARAEAWIRSEAFAKVATPDVGIAGALRYATSCSARHDLLPKAAAEGERRALAFLNVAKAPTGCGRRARSDCFPCLRKDAALANAIAAIEKRL